SKLQPLLRAFGNQSQLAGSLVMEWEGSGDAAKVNNFGKLKLSLEKGRYGNMQSLQANADATYSPAGLDIPNIFLRSDKMQFQIIAASKGDTLEISKIELDQAQAKYAGGYISIPLVWRKLGSSAAFPASGKVAAVFQSENLDIKRLFQDLGLKPPVSGLLNVKLDAAGTLGDLTARFDLHMRDLRNENARNLEPATFDLTAETHGQQLNVVGKFQQAKIQPVELTANLPLDIPKIASERRLGDETPV